MDGAALQVDNLPAPGTIWTYLMSEETFGSPNERFVAGLAKLLTRRGKDS